MPRYLPTLNAVRAFEAAGRHESFSGAANELNVTHAAISRHVRGLEKQLGVQLFKKIARGVELTDNGKLYLKGITPALDQISTSSEYFRSKSTGTISISCEPTYALKWLMPHLGEFQDTHPEIDLKLVSSHEVADIKNNEFDVAIRYCTQEYEGLVRDLISAIPVYPYGVPSFSFASTPNDLLQYRLLHEDKGQLWTRWFEKAGHENFKLPSNANPLSSLLAIEGALAGHGIVLTSPDLVASDVKNNRLKCLSNIGLSFGGYYLVYLREVGRRKSVSAFRKWIIRATSEFR